MFPLSTLSSVILACLFHIVFAAQCAPGNYITADGECEPCIPGSFQPLADQNSCIPCQDGLMSSEASSTQCVPCRDDQVPNRFNNACECRSGLVTADNNDDCVPCPPGERAVSPNRCVRSFPSCAEGTFRSQDDGRCIPCSESGALRSRSCGPCPEFHTPNLNTFETDLACVRSMNGRSLPTPRPGPDGMLQQALCPNGLGTEFGGRAFDLSKCTFVSCPDGTGVLRDGSCATCNAGSFYNRLTNECELCAPRFFTAQENVFSSCFSCGGDSFSMRGATECVKCPINQALMATGQCEGCPPGTFYHEEELRCAPCTMNTFSDGELQMNGCSACPEGTYSFPGSRTCREDLCGRDRAPMQETGDCGTCLPGMEYMRNGTCTMCVPDLLTLIPRVKLNFGLFGCVFCTTGGDGRASADLTRCSSQVE